MSYADAPSTRMLASHCCACRRPLRDAESVELGIGPICRKKYGFDISQGEPDWSAALDVLAGHPHLLSLIASADGTLAGLDARAAANKLIHQAAVVQDDRKDLPLLVASIRALGYSNVAAAIADAMCTVKVQRTDAELLIAAPYVEGAAPSWHRLGGAFDRATKKWSVPSRARKGVWALLLRLYPGHLADTPLGVIELKAA